MHVAVDNFAKQPVSTLFLLNEKEDGTKYLDTVNFRKTIDSYGNLYLSNRSGDEGYLKTGWEAKLKDHSLFQSDSHGCLIAPEKVVRVAGYLIPGRGIFVSTSGWLCDHRFYEEIKPDNVRVNQEKWELEYFQEEQCPIEFAGPCIKIENFTKPLAFIRPEYKDYLQDLRHMGIDPFAEAMAQGAVDIINPVTYIYNGTDIDSWGGPGLGFGMSAHDRVYSKDELFKEVFFDQKFSTGFKSRIDGRDCLFQATMEDLAKHEVLVYKKRDGEYSWPFFYDPIQSLVRIKKVIGNHYFLSDNGYVCHTGLYEKYDWRKHRGKSLLL